MEGGGKAGGTYDSREGWRVEQRRPASSGYIGESTEWMSPKNSAGTRTDLLLGGRRTSRDLASNQLWGRPTIQMSIFGRFTITPSPSPVEPVAQGRVLPTCSLAGVHSQVQLVGQLGCTISSRCPPRHARSLAPRPQASSSSPSTSTAVPVSERTTRRIARPNRCWDPQQSLACMLARY